MSETFRRAHIFLQKEDEDIFEPLHDVWTWQGEQLSCDRIAVQQYPGYYHTLCVLCLSRRQRQRKESNKLIFDDATLGRPRIDCLRSAAVPLATRENNTKSRDHRWSTLRTKSFLVWVHVLRQSLHFSRTALQLTDIPKRDLCGANALFSHTFPSW